MSLILPYKYSPLSCLDMSPGIPENIKKPFSLTPFRPPLNFSRCFHFQGKWQRENVRVLFKLQVLSRTEFYRLFRRNGHRIACMRITTVTGSDLFNLKRAEAN